jgi:hypothetical protein
VGAVRNVVGDESRRVHFDVAHRASLLGRRRRLDGAREGVAATLQCQSQLLRHVSCIMKLETVGLTDEDYVAWAHVCRRLNRKAGRKWGMAGKSERSDRKDAERMTNLMRFRPFVSGMRYRLRLLAGLST